MATRSKAQSITVPTNRLLERVMLKREERLAQHQKNLDQYEHDLKRWQEDCIALLEDALERARRGEFKQDYHGRLSLGVGLANGPIKPTLALETYDRDIALLRMTEEESIVISLNSDWVRYL